MTSKKRKPLADAQEAYIDWCAAGDWLVVDIDTGTIRKRQKLTQLADELGYSRQALYKWNDSIPDFKERVEHTRYGQIIARNGSVWNALYRKAVIELDVNAQRIWLANFHAGFKDPNSTKVKANRCGAKDTAPLGLLDLAALARDLDDNEAWK